MNNCLWLHETIINQPNTIPACKHFNLDHASNIDAKFITKKVAMEELH